MYAVLLLGKQCRINNSESESVRMKDAGYIGRRMLMMEWPENRKRGMPKRRFMDVMKEDMADFEVTEEDTEAGTTGDGKSAVATPGGKSRQKKKNIVSIVCMY